ncbi:hypothetical protein WwAna1124 [Wolbachia endosymbiont of Drosophila ananassae]|nr:hypothetical protein WwAna1124 [Wolbachia endosymbiont of Drosophila ananassae]
MITSQFEFGSENCNEIQKLWTIVDGPGHGRKYGFNACSEKV